MILREDLVEYSVLELVKADLPEYGYILAPAEKANLVVKQAFPTPEERNEELRQNTLAFGFNIDDGGREMECGSTLTQYEHTLVAWVFGIEPNIAKQVANSIKHIARHGENGIPLLDFSQDGNPQIDTLLVRKVQCQHQPNSSERPWDRYVWSTSMKLIDAYYV